MNSLRDLDILAKNIIGSSKVHTIPGVEEIYAEGAEYHLLIQFVGF